MSASDDERALPERNELARRCNDQFGEARVKREAAKLVKRKALEAIQSLHDITKLLKKEDITEVWKPLGILIGRIDHDVLTVIYRQYPELDDLKPDV